MNYFKERKTVFPTTNRDNLKSLAFLDPKGGVGIQRFEQVKYKQFEKIIDKQLGFFWLPHEIDTTKDRKDFKTLTESEKHIFTSNLKRQILLDSVNGRSPNLALLPIVSIPELETWIELWAFNETIHSRSYTHIIRTLYPNPSAVFDEIFDIKEIMDCAVDITKYIDDLIEAVGWYNLLGKGRFKVINKANDEEMDVTVGMYQLKKKLWLAINSINALEGIRFYVSFACSWAFAELKKMEGNAKIIKLICRDENLHLASTQTLLKILPKDDKDFIKIKKECENEVIQMFDDVVQQEKQWAAFLFNDGSMIGLNEQLLCDYVEWIANKRLLSLGLPSPYKGGTNPLPWTQKWIAGGDVQVAPQEVELSSYITGGVKQDVEEDTFKDFKL